MKTTDKPLFSNGTEFMWWQDRNCCRCRKAVWYNPKRNTYPQYRCALQRDIEQQAGGMEEINVRSYRLIHGCAKCPLFIDKCVPAKKTAPKGEEMPLFDANEFANGQCIVEAVKAPQNEKETANRAIPEAKPEKEKRETSQNDPEAEEIARKMGVKVEDVTDAEQKLWEIIRSNGFKPIRHYAPGLSISEHKFKAEVRSVTATMLETFTWEENMLIAFVPLVISHIAWMYADRVLKHCGRNKMRELRELTRSVKETRERYVNDLRKDLDYIHVKRIERQSEQFFKEYANDFTILWYQCNQALKDQIPGLPHESMYTDAFCGVMMVRLLKEHNSRMDKVIAAKLGHCTPSINNPFMLGLETLLEACIPDGLEIRVTRFVGMCMKVLAQRVYRIEFGVKDE